MTKFVHTADWQLGNDQAVPRCEEQARYSQAQLDTVVSHSQSRGTHEGCAFVVGSW